MTLPARGVAEVALQQPLEFEQRLVVERDGVEVLRLQAPLPQAVGDGVGGEVGVVLLAGEPLLLRRRDDPPVPHEAGGGVVVEAGEVEDVHAEAGGGGAKLRALPYPHSASRPVTV